MPALKPLVGTLQVAIPSKSGAVNFFFNQDSNNLKRKWSRTNDDFWNATRPSISNAAPNWTEFESWQSAKKK